MPYALNFNGTGYVSIPSKVTADGVGFAHEFDFEIPNYTNQNLYGREVSGSFSSLRITSATQMVVRVASATTLTMNLSASIPLNTRCKLKFIREYVGTRNLVVLLNGAEVYRLNSAPFENSGGTDDVRLIGKSINGTFSGKMYAANINGTVYLNESSPDTSSWGDGTLTSIPSTNWTLYSDGTAPTGTVTIGTIVPNSTGASAPFTYDAADQTGFEYQLNETGTIYPISASPATPTGLTPSTPYTIRVRAKNASGDGAWSTSAPFTTSAAGSPPAGTFTVGTITTTQTTASVPYTYSAADFDTIEYRIDGGAAVTASASPQALTGLTSATTYGIEFRAVNTFGNGAWSTSAPFTTASVPVGTITITDIANNTDTPWISSAVDAATIMPLSLGSVVVNKTGLSTTAGADLVIADAAVVTGTEYIIILKIGTAYGWYRAVAT